MTRLTYTYDFGDTWGHEVLVEQVCPAEPGEELPTCLEGRWACPPEDAASTATSGLAVVHDRRYPDHEDVSEWLGSWDAEAFDVERTAAWLRRIG